MPRQWRETIRKRVETLVAGLSMYTPKAWLITPLAAAMGLAAIGITTAIFENWFFVRMMPVRTQDYVIRDTFVGAYWLDRWKLLCGQLDGW